MLGVLLAIQAVSLARIATMTCFWVRFFFVPQRSMILKYGHTILAKVKSSISQPDGYEKFLRTLKEHVQNPQMREVLKVD